MGFDFVGFGLEALASRAQVVEEGGERTTSSILGLSWLMRGPKRRREISSSAWSDSSKLKLPDSRSPG